MIESKSSFSGRRFSSLLIFTVSLFMLLDSGATVEAYKKGFLDRSYPENTILGPLGGVDGPKKDFAFLTKDGTTFPQELESAFVLEHEPKANKVWPSVILDYMRHQLRFRGRTKKAAKKDERIKDKSAKMQNV